MSTENLRRLLATELEWPHRYRFKFVIPAAARDALVELLPGAELSFRTSKGNRYVSVTAEMQMESPDTVIEVYERAKRIEGLIAL
jgi:hypothetical protein